MFHLYYFYIILAFIALVSFFYYILNSYYARVYNDDDNKIKGNIKDVTAVIPVYNENPEIFESVIKSLINQCGSLIVVGDSSYEPYRSITEKFNGRFIYLKKHSGKRLALVEGIKNVKTRYVLFVDSDTLVPEKATLSMLSKFKRNVGGVGVNINIKNDGSGIAYASEFIERVREVIFRAMSYHGSILVADGRCAMYLTEAVRPLLLSNDFMNKKILGKKTMLGDDIQITSYLIKSGYKVVKDYNVTVQTEPQRDFKRFFRQQIRWSRNGWYYFFKNISNGTARRAGWFYSFDLLYMYIIPIAGLILVSLRLIFYLFVFRHLDYDAYYMMRFIMHDIIPIARHHFINEFYYIHILTSAVTDIFGTVGEGFFILTVMGRIPKKRLRTLAYGALGLLIMFIANIYGLFTFWRQGSWLTR
ncbi:glycosyltransferase family 2 protein [Picrophilus oshimae]|uniref:Glycosyltransferase 2-like domain-containing protein n=1 Tax=Picrophilus torridus (strain ATCC 700027 / DSM 9790 / JCM 10055 / NBRC 100828 / KAW 2/3) TaxID=1122961 RepID=A0A8G2FX95_PICTO|nr:glycosyltransferase family 2 protein [Picrophilus oshimae]SMD31177.1 hypothetical protein SAMN02745355_1100 [Picrophilus oshimae DSM 9789]